MKFTDAIDGFFLDKEFSLTDKTAKRYSYVFNRLYKFLGNVQVEEITSQDIKKFLRHLKNETKLSERSIFDYYGTLSSFWSWAEKELEIEHVIRGKIDRPRFTKRKIEPLTMDEVKKLIKACDYSQAWKNKPSSRNKNSLMLRDKAAIIVMVDCGIRVGELCALTIADYNGQRLHVRQGKWGKERFLPLGTRAKKALWRYLSIRGDPEPDEPLLASRAGTALDTKNVGRMCRTTGKRAGVPNVHPHRFRHTFAIEFLRNGGNPYELKEMLGHSTLNMVLNYLALAETDLEKAQRRSSPADKWRL